MNLSPEAIAILQAAVATDDGFVLACSHKTGNRFALSVGTQDLTKDLDIRQATRFREGLETLVTIGLFIQKSTSGYTVTASGRAFVETSKAALAATLHPTQNALAPPDLETSPVGLSHDAHTFAEILVRRSKYGCDSDPTLTIEDLERHTGFDSQRVVDTIHELIEHGLAIDSPDPTSRLGYAELRTNTRIFLHFDSRFMGWDPSADARTLAQDLVAERWDGNATESLAATLGWPLRRLNPALTYLLENSLVGTTDECPDDNLVVFNVFATSRTRRWLSRTQVDAGTLEPTAPVRQLVTSDDEHLSLTNKPLARESSTPQAAKVVFALHGIRTHAKWTHTLSQVAANHGWKARTDLWNFGFFSALKLLLPGQRLAKIRWFRETYTTECNDRALGLDIDNGTLPSIVAHSFGTYIVGSALLRYDYLKFDKIILCGSILPPDFDWSTVIARGQVRAIRNEYGKSDFWSGIVHRFVKGCGPSGRIGFSSSLAQLEQEYFLFSHSEYFQARHMEAKWFPFLDGRRIPQIAVVQQSPTRNSQARLPAQSTTNAQQGTRWFRAQQSMDTIAMIWLCMLFACVNTATIVITLILIKRYF